MGEKNSRQATQIDEGWRSQSESKRKATEIDEGWRSNGRQATQVDVGWRQGREESPDSTNDTNKIIPNYFSSIDDFKDTAEKLQELKSSDGNIYSVEKTISRAGGESIILLCSDADGKDAVAKIYYEPVNGANLSISSRNLVLDYMKTEEGKRYTLAVKETGFVKFGKSEYYFEIMPYCKSTDLSDDGPYPFDQLVEITRQLNEALHSIHLAGIIHRDIKPENLFKFDGQYKLGDFGIAKNGAQGRSRVTEHILGTEGYAAPETRLYRYSEKSDYYSLGVTLASLFEGHFVLDDMTYEMQANLQDSERLPLKRYEPNREKLENLLNGLCKFSPKDRFGYEEVNRWLADHDYTGGLLDGEWPAPFRTLKSKETYSDEKSMFDGFTKDGAHWEEAKELLYSERIKEFFAPFRTDLARSAQIVGEAYRAENPDKGLSLFLKDLFAPGPIVWKGYTFSSTKDLGNKMVATKTPLAYSELLQNNCISHWLSNTEGLSPKPDDKTKKLVDAIEKLSATEPKLACYWFGNSFAPKKMLKICNQTVSSLDELIKALFKSPKDFYQTDGYDKLLDRTGGADLYGFLYSFGYKELIDESWQRVTQVDTFDKVSILISMIDNIAIKAGVNPELIRNFYVNYGPVGVAVYTKKLVKEKIYIPLDSNGRQLLDKILDFKEPTSGSVTDLFRAYSPLVDSVYRLRPNLIENPHCIIAGAYDKNGVICTNLLGCFAFKIFDREAPLGFSAWLEDIHSLAQIKATSLRNKSTTTNTNFAVEENKRKKDILSTIGKLLVLLWTICIAGISLLCFTVFRSKTVSSDALTLGCINIGKTSFGIAPFVLGITLGIYDFWMIIKMIKRKWNSFGNGVFLVFTGFILLILAIDTVFWGKTVLSSMFALFRWAFETLGTK